jgi:chaperone required for assembly of F1-ATPase
MRELFENAPAEDPIEAVRRTLRPALPRRFYETAATAAVAEGHAVRLDGKPVRTPAGRLLAAPTLALAQAIAAEWDAERDVIDPAKMPLTRLANAIIDGVCDHPGPVAAEVEKYLATDLVCYRAASPRGLVERQARRWDPILDWARSALGADFSLGEGVIYVPQPAPAIAAARAAIPDDPWRLGAVHTVTTLTGSALAIARAAYGGRSLGRGACRRGLEHGAVGPRRDRARAPRVPLCGVGGGGEGAGFFAVRVSAANRVYREG